MQKLHKSANGLIELFLLSQNSNTNNNNLNNALKIFPIASSSGLYTGTSGTLPRAFTKKSLGSNQMNMDPGFRRVSYSS